MGPRLPFVLLPILFHTAVCGQLVAPRIETLTGQVAERVSEVTRQPDGLLRIVHDAGVWRVADNELTAESLHALGLEPVADSQPQATSPLTVIETIDGRRFTGIRSSQTTPSTISIVYQDGAARLRIAELTPFYQHLLRFDPERAATFDREQEAKRERQEEECLRHAMGDGPPEALQAATVWMYDGHHNSSGGTIRVVPRAVARKIAVSMAGYRWVWVAGHYRGDGVWVPGHYRTSPNATTNDNWTTLGNVNPVTKEAGTLSKEAGRLSPSRSRSYSSGTISVRGYYRKDGTYVRPHTRRR